MADPIQTYRTKVSGLWNPRHTILDAEGQTLGVLQVRRNRLGMVVSGEYRPEQGEVLSFRREPGLLRAQFSLWTDGKEWLGSSLRWNVIRRSIEVWTSGKPYRIVPARGFRPGWRLVASKTGEMAAIRLGWLPGSGATLLVHRKMDFELLLFSYFLGAMTRWESIAPTFLETLDRGHKRAAAPGGA